MTTDVREAAAILFADLAGFTALTEAHGDAEAANLAGSFYELARSALRGDARLVKTIGDAVMIVGREPADVAQTAVCLVQAVEAAPDFPALRVGLHAGPVIERDGDYFGSAVNLAARIAAYAHAGQILCSAAAARALRDSGSFREHRLGKVHFKNILEPVEVVQLDLETGAHAASGNAFDPVCRMRVDPDSAPARLPFGDRTYVFCSLACARAFALAPEAYCQE